MSLQSRQEGDLQLVFEVAVACVKRLLDMGGVHGGNSCDGRQFSDGIQGWG